MSEWISVKDRLPKWLEDVLVYYETGHIGIDWVDCKKEFIYAGIYGEATHWMPLPEPPKEN